MGARQGSDSAFGAREHQRARVPQVRGALQGWLEETTQEQSAPDGAISVEILVERQYGSALDINRLASASADPGIDVFPAICNSGVRGAVACPR